MPPKRAANSAVGVSVPRLEGSLVRLELLSRDHCASLLDVVKEDVDLYQWTPVPRAAREMERYIETAREGYAQGHMLPFAIVQIGIMSNIALQCHTCASPKRSRSRSHPISY